MEQVKQFLYESARVKHQIADTLAEEIGRAIDRVYLSLSQGGKVLLMGNGGSAGDAQHIAAELVGRYKNERKALPAIALTVDSSALTAISNDYGYDRVFERQVEAICRPEDVVIGISTSGNSENVNRAFKRARSLQAGTIALLGKGGGYSRECVDISIIVPSADTPRIQESHITIGHIICELVEQKLIHEKKI